MKWELFFGTLLSIALVVAAVLLGQQAAVPVATTPTLVLTLEEIAKHNNRLDCWFVIDGSVYNVTGYFESHPGGEKGLLFACGKDATESFVTKGGRGAHSAAAYEDLIPLKLGTVNSAVAPSTVDQTTEAGAAVPAREESEPEEEEERD